MGHQVNNWAADLVAKVIRKGQKGRVKFVPPIVTFIGSKLNGFMKLCQAIFETYLGLRYYDRTLDV